MSPSPYAIPEAELVTRARVPVEQQVVEQQERRLAGGETSSGPLPYGDGASVDDGGE